MEFLLARIKHFFLWPFELFREDNLLGGLWQQSGRGRALLLGLPALLFAFFGLGLLMVAEFGWFGSLESRYQSAYETSSTEKLRVLQELESEVNLARLENKDMKPEDVNDVIPRDDPRRKQLAMLEEEERIYLNKLNALNPNEPEYMYKLAILTIRQRDGARGLAMMRKIAPTDEPGYLEAHLELARFDMEAAKARPEISGQLLSRALVHTDQALRRDPSSVSAHLLKGKVLYQGGRLSDAYNEFEILFEAEPRAYQMLVDLNNRMNRGSANSAVLRNAIERFRLQLNSQDRKDLERIATLKDLKDCYMMQQEYQLAESLLVNEVKAYDDEEDADKNDPLVADKAEQCRKLLSNVYLGWVSTIEGTDDAASMKRIEYLRKALEQDPGNPSALRQVTRLGGSASPQVSAAATAIYDPGQDLSAPAAVINELGIQALSRSEYDEALRLFTKANQKSPKNPEILNNLAYTYLKSSTPNPRLALTMIDDAIRYTNPASLGIYRSNFFDTRGRALMQLKQWNLAIADLSKALADRPENVDILEAIVECCRANQLDSEAEIWQAKLDAVRKKLANPGG